jgi:hypothetical protein
MTTMQSAEYQVGLHARQLHEAEELGEHRMIHWEREALEHSIRRLREAEARVPRRCC